MITVVIEPKFNIDLLNPYRGGSTAALLSLQRAVSASLLPHVAILTPQAVQGTAPTMRAALSTCGWPAASEVRGAIMLVLDVWCVTKEAFQVRLLNSPASRRTENKDAAAALRNVPLRDQLFFIRASESEPQLVSDDAVLVEPDECGCAVGFDRKRCTAVYSALVQAGYLVRAAVGTAMCAPHEASHRSAAAAAAGVQLLTTDYLEDAALPCGKTRAACCVPNRTSAAPCELDGDTDLFTV